MRKIITSALVTLDGVAEDPGGYGGTSFGGWALPYFGEESVRLSIEALAGCDYFLCGRRTYEMFAAAWGNAEGPYGDRLRSLRKLVASSTLKGDLTWNAELLEGDTIAALKQLKKQDGGDIIMYGNPTLLRSLLANDLVDELDLMLHPVLLGTGQKLFADDTPQTKLALNNQTALDNGVTILSYRI
ncbi:dihydrofolate reductase family protein [Kribbella jiaozuonensis]|uniref:Pyrimidine reductase n=1 Tax=Kribbella jiaozuonensis TaxID=2575441 RepID=A0A4U3LU47_9ACTN|nr:dihydrofolate reductase family protein [Kribbella jiaozuonensis]TKK78067.1 pyrimidine reductase [Kribbella jiaozuonensis]